MINIQKHEKVLLSFLDEMNEIDFEKKANISPIEKIPRHDIVVLVIDEILSLAKSKGWGIRVRDDQFSVFNGAYWKYIKPDDLKKFLGIVTAKLGYKLLRGRHFQFSIDLYKQLMLSGFSSVPENSSRNIVINFQNGSLEVDKDGRYHFRDFDPKDLIYYQLPFEYDPNATAPLFEEFLKKVLVDESQRDILAEFSGYVFVKSLAFKLEKILMLYGASGANGKSTFFLIFYALLGQENISSFSLQALTNENGYFRAQIQNKLVNFSSELGGAFNEEIFKKLISQEPIEARNPYGRPFILDRIPKFMVNSNELPDSSSSPAYFRRFLILSFDQTIPESEQDPALASRIIESELPGVLNWVLAGLERLISQKGFTYSEKSEQALTDYKRKSDAVNLMFIDLGYTPGETLSIALKDSYDFFKSYCSTNGFRQISITKYSESLRKLGFRVERKSNGNVIYYNKV